MEKPIRVLQILPGGKVNGGIENFIMNFYRKIDKNKVQFDFLVHYKEKGYFDEEIIKLGGKIYYFSIREDNNFIKYIYELMIFFRNHKEYKIVHGHMSSLAFIYFFIAKINGVKIRVAHSHINGVERNIKGKILEYLIKLIKYTANYYLACSDEAGKYMFKNRRYLIIKNAIDIERFKFNSLERKKIRSELGIENNFVLGHIGRFNLQKNHDYLLQIFKKIYIKDSKIKLLLIGDGPLKYRIKQRAEKEGVANGIIFKDATLDISNYLFAMDLFLLPSYFEGLGIVAIEAQTTGLKTIVSEFVPEEAKISSLFKKYKLSEMESWIGECIKKEKNNRVLAFKEIEKPRYNINNESANLLKYYIEILSNNKK